MRCVCNVPLLLVRASLLLLLTCPCDVVLGRYEFQLCIAFSLYQKHSHTALRMCPMAALNRKRSARAPFLVLSSLSLDILPPFRILPSTFRTKE